MMQIPRRGFAIGVLLVLGASAALFAHGADRPAVRERGDAALELAAVLGRTEGTELFKVKAAAFLDSSLVVLTGADPFVHVFTGGRHRAWGAKGNGPGEFAGPEDLSIQDGRILVRDGTLEKIVTFDAGGRYLATRALRPYVVNRFFVQGGDTLLGLSAHQQSTRAIARVHGARVDTLMRYSLPEPLRLSAPGSPSLSTTPPYAPVPHWAVLRDGRIAYWDGRSTEIALLRAGTGRVGALALPGGRFPVGAAERDEWLNQEIPQSFMGRRLFEPLRARARETVEFPRSLPPVLDLMPDPVEGVWVRQTTAASGERWSWTGRGGVAGSFRLPAGARLLAVGRQQLAVLVKDADEVETVQLYRKPAR